MEFLWNFQGFHLRKVFCFDLSMTHMARPCGCVVVPQTQELHFTYLPGGAEIISIDAFNRKEEKKIVLLFLRVVYRHLYPDPGSHYFINKKYIFLYF